MRRWTTEPWNAVGWEWSRSVTHAELQEALMACDVYKKHVLPLGSLTTQ
jgi:hypothetical protein